jgi:hypothetical protein
VFGVCVSGLGLRFRVQSLGFGVADFRFQVSGLGVRFSDSGLRFESLGFGG